MGVEIERKFLVADDSWRQEVVRSTGLRQGYLAADNRRSVRVRDAGSRGYTLTVKAGNGEVWPYPLSMPFLGVA